MKWIRLLLLSGNIKIQQAFFTGCKLFFFFFFLKFPFLETGCCYLNFWIIMSYIKIKSNRSSRWQIRPATLRPSWPCPPHPSFFCEAKRNKKNKGKKERVSRQKLLKGSHQGQNVTVLAILESLEFQNFTCRSTMVADNTFQCSMAPPLWNPFCRFCRCSSK